MKAVLYTATWCFCCTPYRTTVAKVCSSLGIDLDTVDLDFKPNAGFDVGVTTVPTLAVGRDRLVGVIGESELRSRLADIVRRPC